MSTADLAVIAMAVVTLANTGAVLLGLRTVAKQLRIAAPAKEDRPQAAAAGGEGM